MTARRPLVDHMGDVQTPLDEVETTAVAAETDGYDGYLVAETRHDPFVGLTLAARATARIALGSAIAVAFARNPMTTAILANDLQLVSRGRFRLGLGTQVRPHVERRFSMPWSAPADRMREYVEAVRAIWTAWETGEPLRFEGRHYRHTLMTPFFSPGPNPYGRPPILLAAVGERMTETAGEVADGLLCHSFTTVRYLHDVTVPALRRGGRDVPLAVAPFVIAGDGPRDRAAAEAGTRRQLAFYASTPAYAPVLALDGREALHDRLRVLARNGEWDAMPGEISDDVLADFAVTGTPAEIAAALLDRFGEAAARLSFNTPYAADPVLLDEIRTHLTKEPR